MDTPNPFAHLPATAASISAQVCQQLTVDFPAGVDTQGTALSSIAEAAVHDLWGGRVTTFVPVLALRQAREVLREQGLEMPPRATRGLTG
jgi:hypothetical protein